MAKATFTSSSNDLSWVVDPIIDLSMQPPYWMVKRETDDNKVIRDFYNFSDIKSVTIEGEEELIQAAKARVGNPEQLAQQLGLEE